MHDKKIIYIIKELSVIKLFIFIKIILQFYTINKGDYLI